MILLITNVSAQEKHRIESDGTVHVPAFVLPESAYLSDETRAVLKQQRDIYAKGVVVGEACPPIKGADRADMPLIRQCLADAYYQTPKYKSLRDRYDVTMTPLTIDGVYTEVFTPDEGIASRNEKRVLINLHGGGFHSNSRIASHNESVPIASVGKIKVISIDYRMAPEYKFPAASEDVAVVYRALLKDYAPENIGIYGCSAGGLLTAQSIAWFQDKGLPLPGAVGIFCIGAGGALDKNTFKLEQSDGKHIGLALVGVPELRPMFAYFDGVNRLNPLVSPGGYDAVMAQFPPTLLLAGSRGFALSDVVYTHSQLTRLGVEADLHLWEGMGHGFTGIPDLPESREAYDVIVKFFDRHLGRKEGKEQ